MKFIRRGFWLCLFIFLGAGTWLADYAYSPVSPEADTLVFIPKGSGVRTITTLLAGSGLLPDDIRFPLLARLSGKAGRLRAGEYRIPPRRTPLQILQILAKGEVVLHRLTIPEGLTVKQVADVLAQDNWIDPQRFLSLTSNPGFITSLGLNRDNLEGYLFPDTYSLARGEVSEESLIKMMTDRFLAVWNEVSANFPSDMERRQVIVLASIVEKETGDPAERPLIARVFLNRLEKKMKLQSDPTVIYGLDNFSGNITKKDLTAESPYNTYLIPGLPPTPICNPGRESILAVLRPADAPYYYFVSKNNGAHHFSATLEEHNRAVREYQKSRKNRDKASAGPQMQ